MALSKRAQKICDQLDAQNPKMGDVKKCAAKIKKDHELALELWSTGEFGPRLVAVLIMDKGQLDQNAIEGLAKDIASHPEDQRDKLSEWLMAHQLMKSKRTTTMIESWKDHPSPTLRRLFWYHQGRLRWMGKIPTDNGAELIKSIDEQLEKESPEVQWAMNFTAGWIGVHDPKYRDQCIKIGERVGLYKGDHVHPGCTPNYLPEFIAMEADKAGK